MSSSQKNKILVICQHFWPESFRINDIANFFVEKDCDIDVLCGIPNYPKGKFFDGYSIFNKRREIHDKANIRRVFEIPRGSSSNLRIFINYISFPISSIFHIPRLLTKKYDKILLYQLSPVMMTIAGIIVGKIKKIETTMYILDLWPENLFSVMNIKNKLLRKLVTNISHWHYRKVDKIIVLSERMKQKIVDITGIDNKKIIILPQACEKIYETNINDKTLEKKFGKGFNIVFTGNISPAQSFDTIIEAAAMLKKDGIDDINWIIVGDGMSKKHVEAQVKKAKLDDNFYFEGFKQIDDMPRYTGIADILIGCLVKSELLEATIPAKVMSYIASSKPIVLAMDGEVKKLINNEIKCGFAGPAGDADALCANIKKAYHMSDNERIIMGQKARDYHFKHFERNIILTQMHDFIFDIK